MTLFLLLAACKTDSDDNFVYSNSGVNTDFVDDNGGSGGGGGGGDDTGGSGGSDTASGDDTGDTGDTSGGGSTGDPPTDGTGYSVGDVAYNLQGTNQLGAPWALYDQLGSPVVLIVGHLDLGASMTDGLEAVGSANATDVALIGRNQFSTASTQDNALETSTKYGLSTVLYDPTYAVVDTWSDGAAPKAYVIDSEMVIRWVGFGGSITESAINGALEDL